MFAKSIVAPHVADAKNAPRNIRDANNARSVLQEFIVSSSAKMRAGRNAQTAPFKDVLIVIHRYAPHIHAGIVVYAIIVANARPVHFLNVVNTPMTTAMIAMIPYARSIHVIIATYASIAVNAKSARDVATNTTKTN